MLTTRYASRLYSTTSGRNINSYCNHTTETLKNLGINKTVASLDERKSPHSQFMKSLKMIYRADQVPLIKKIQKLVKKSKKNH